jgi:hypothetical protein
MFLGNFEGYSSVRDRFILQSLRLGIEVFAMSTVKRLEQILGCWHELTRFCIDCCEKVETLEVEREVFDVLSEFDNAHNQLY